MEEIDKHGRGDAFTRVAPYYDHLMAGVPYRFWVEYLERLWRQHGASPRSVLDVACGTGTVSRMLYQRGYSVSGVDLAVAMVELARERALEHNLPIPFFQQDAAELDLPGHTFDAAISLFDSLNYILEPARLAEAFRRICVHLGPAGSLVFDLNTEYALAEGFFNQSCSRKHEPLHYRWRARYDRDTRLCTITMRFVLNREEGDPLVFTEVHRQRAYTRDEITGFLQAAGFTHVAAYDAYSLDPPNKRSDRIFYFAGKG